MSANLHELDFYAWTQQQLALLRTGDFSKVDVKNLIDEVASMGASERKELMSRLEVLLAHLLKWQFQAQRRGRSWELTIQEQRSRLSDLLDENPSLGNPDTLQASLAKAYKYAAIAAQRETRLSAGVFPGECPYSLENVLDNGFYPAGHQ
jgi:hypothetical protein